jgi:hypothetical protein
VVASDQPLMARSAAGLSAKVLGNASCDEAAVRDMAIRHARASRAGCVTSVKNVHRTLKGARKGARGSPAGLGVMLGRKHGAWPLRTIAPPL